MAAEALLHDAAVAAMVAGAVLAAGVRVALLRHRHRRVDPPGDGNPGETVVFVPGGLDERDLELLRLAERGVTVSEAARLLGLSKSVVSRKLRKLEAMGLVERRLEGGRVVYRRRG